MKDIIISGLSKSFGEKKVLDNLNLTIPAGEITCVMGPSGCGKTTLFNILAGLLEPDSGTVEGMPERISFVFQEDRLCPAYSAAANVRLVTGNTVSREKIASDLAELGLGDSAGLPSEQLSGGMKRRAAIARAVLYGGDVFLLDEAFKGLDEERKRQTMDYVKSRTAGKTVICVTHDAEEAEYLGGKIIKL